MIRHPLPHQGGEGRVFHGFWVPQRGMGSREEIAAQPQQPAAPTFSQLLSFRAPSVRLPAGLVMLGLIVLVFTALGSPARGKEATPPLAPRPAPLVDSTPAEKSEGAMETGEASRGVP